MKFLPNTNKSRLIHTEFKGFPLSDGLYCIDNNIDKTNHILALAVNNKMSCYFIEIYSDIDFSELKFGQRLPDDSKYLKMEFDSYIRLMVFTHLPKEWVKDLMVKIGADFVITDVVQDCSDAESILDVTRYAYSLTENVLTPKKSRKGKRFTGSDLSPREKEFSLVFTLNAEIIRPS
jgi:hypothetical protein